mgnify:FL=1|jgi:hypothetical protein|tara:strand:- start:306 stop:1382 length:1077 start_codon:yes stop_codon:yes gene_type:complete
MYYREFGIPARIGKCKNIEDIESLTQQYNGKKNCYASVYVFDELRMNDDKTNYETALLNTIWFDFDDNKDIKKCLMDIRRFIRQFCKPLNIVPRIYLTGGKGFQMNIDFFSYVEIPDHIKRKVLKEYILNLKNKYKLKTLDEICINNSVSCMRRIPNTQYISKITGEPTGVWCTQFSVNDIMKLSVEELYGVAVEPTETIAPEKSTKAQRNFVEFVCDMYEIKHTVSNSVDYLLNKVAEAAGSIKHIKYASLGNEYIKPPRRCIIELIERNIKRGHSSHEQNNIIAFELINGGWSDRDISFVFMSIYNEPSGDWGWYSDDLNTAGRHIEAMREKALNRYSVDKLIQLGICKGDKCSCT